MPAQPQILVVEDDADLAELLSYNLSQEGFSCQIMHNGLEAYAWLKNHSPQLALLDVMLPGMDGFTLCRRLRAEHKDVFIIMLTARAEEIDKLLGLSLGADDYVTKPFSMRELSLRIKAVLRRTRAATRAKSFGALSIDEASRKVSLNGQDLMLTATEFDLLLFLAQNPGRVYNRDSLLEHVWGYRNSGYARTVDTHMRRLRQKLAAGENHLETVRGVGYRFNPDPPAV